MESRRFGLTAATGIMMLLLPLAAPAAQCDQGSGDVCCCCCVCSCSPCGAVDEDDGTDDAADEAQQTDDYGSSIVTFNELFPNPVGTDSEQEFIELKNGGEQAVSLEGWRIKDGKGRSFTLGDLTVEPESFLSLPYSSTGIPLPNGGGLLTLLDPSGVERDSVGYDSPVPEGSSYGSFAAGWVWTTTPTPDGANLLTVPPAQPDEAVDDDGGSEGDAVVEDDIPTDTEETPDPPGEETGAALVLLSEIMPNPVGEDASGEWIELYNAGDEADLAGWSIDDEEGGSAPHEFGAGTVIPAGEYLVVPRIDSGLALNNDTDMVRLFSADGILIDSVAYADVNEGETFARGDGTWSWTGTPTPGAANDFAPETTESTNDGDVDQGREAEAESLTVAAAHELPDGATATVIGVVSLPTGVIGKTIFGLQDTDAGSAVTARIYGDEIPVLVRGDVLTVTGTVSKKDNGELRINTSAAKMTFVGDMDVADHELPLGELNASMAGLAVSVSGRVADIGQEWFLLTDESATAQLRVNLPVPEIAGLTGGDAVSLKGVLRVENSLLTLTVIDTGHVIVAPTGGEPLPSGQDDQAEQILTAEDEGVGSLLPFLTVGAVGAGGMAYRGLRGRSGNGRRKIRKG